MLGPQHKLVRLGCALELGGRRETLPGAGLAPQLRVFRQRVFFVVWLWLRLIVAPGERAGRQQLGEPRQFPDLAFAPVASR